MKTCNFLDVGRYVFGQRKIAACQLYSTGKCVACTLHPLLVANERRTSVGARYNSQSATTKTAAVHFM